jgi:7,8-dihydroneopterin aldolase/epimerase/oxygenase
MAMDIVYIKDLKVDAVIGVYDWEREIHQTLVLSLDMAADISGPAENDELALALDYKAVSDRITEFVSGSDFQLIETLAERLAQLLMSEFKLPWLRLSVSKPGAITMAFDVGVIIERGLKP